MKLSSLLLSAVALVTLSGSCEAQLPPGKWWKDPEWVRNLGLKKPQTDRLEEHFRGARQRLIDLTAEVQKAEIDLEATIEKTPFDEKKASSVGDRLAEARCRVMRAEMGILFAARAILTDEQYSLIRVRMDGMDGPERGRPRGPRPPHDGPPIPDDGRGPGRPRRPPPPSEDRP